VGLIPFTDDPPPVTTLYIGTPKQTDSSGIIQVTSSASFTLTAQDNYGGSGVASTTYQISNSQYNSGWISTSPPTVFQLVGLPDGTYTIEYFSTDFSGNVEQSKTVDVALVSTFEVTFALNPTGAGAVNPTSTNNYALGSQVSISAIANSGYTFWQWKSSNPSITFADSSAVSTTAVINGLGTITATFAKLVSGNKNIVLTGSNNVVVVAGGNNNIDCTQATSTTIVKTGSGNT